MWQIWKRPMTNPPCVLHSCKDMSGTVGDDLALRLLGARVGKSLGGMVLVLGDGLLGIKNGQRAFPTSQEGSHHSVLHGGLVGIGTRETENTGLLRCAHVDILLSCSSGRPGWKIPKATAGLYSKMRERQLVGYQDQ